MADDNQIGVIELLKSRKEIYLKNYCNLMYVANLYLLKYSVKVRYIYDHFACHWIRSASEIPWAVGCWIHNEIK